MPPGSDGWFAFSSRKVQEGPASGSGTAAAWVAVAGESPDPDLHHFLDVRFRIVDIQQTEPWTEDLHSSATPATFALEVRRGWFAEKGILVGDKAEVVFDPPGVRIR